MRSATRSRGQSSMLPKRFHRSREAAIEDGFLNRLALDPDRFHQFEIAVMGGASFEIDDA